MFILYNYTLQHFPQACFYFRPLFKLIQSHKEDYSVSMLIYCRMGFNVEIINQEKLHRAGGIELPFMDTVTVSYNWVTEIIQVPNNHDSFLSIAISEAIF